MAGVSKKVLVAVALVVVLVAAGTADALRLRAGDLLVIGDGGFRPTALPKDRDAPIEIYGGGRITTASGALPTVLKTVTFEFDKHGSIETTGLPACTQNKIEATTVESARKACPGAIVGKGRGSAFVKFDEQAPFKISSPITLFNGPRKGGDVTVIAHAHTTVPVPTALVVPIVIERINNGVYGYRTEARVPRIAGGYGIPASGELTIGRRWTYKGKRYSFVNARCATGRLQARGIFGFNDGTLLRGTFAKRCQIRG
jgi:hypothetical protein